MDTLCKNTGHFNCRNFLQFMQIKKINDLYCHLQACTNSHETSRPPGRVLILGLPVAQSFELLIEYVYIQSKQWDKSFTAVALTVKKEMNNCCIRMKKVIIIAFSIFA